MSKTSAPVFVSVVLHVVLFASYLPAAEPKPFVAELKPDILKFEPFTWPDATPEGCPFVKETGK